VGDLWVAVRYSPCMSIEQTIPKSYIVRVYRVDPEVPDKIAGQVEAVDGAGARTSFTGIGELARALREPAAKKNATGTLKGK